MQHDYNIGSGDSKTGLQVRQDINNALAAIKSSNSGEVAPINPVVGMIWHNTLTNVSYKYTSTGWKAIADEGSVDDIVAPYTVVATSSASASAASAASSLASSQLATSSANFKGNWSSVISYLLGESVLYNGIYYRAVVNNTNQTPLNNPSYWAVAIPINLGNFMMSKAEFNAMVAERRANRAGSGFDEFGKHNPNTAINPNVNEGIYTVSTLVDAFNMGYISGGTGTSKTDYPLSNINGSVLTHKYLNNSASQVNSITLPPAPTVLPSTSTLTQQQIDSGVIKHADASNSGLILNGKFDTDTSGWTSYSSSTLSIDTNRLKILAVIDTYGGASQGFATVIGKKYRVEFVSTKGTNTTFICRVGSSGYGGSELYTSETTAEGYVSFEFTATTTTSYLTLFVKELDTFGFFDNIAVFPADAISRSDLVFLESWHEDVSEKDFVYPLGNVQYLSTTGDAGTTVTGAFAGSATYSLFSDTWQADSALVGKGYVWSTLSDANKKAFVANPENNCYLDGDKVIQVRYRMRVVQGLGDTWYNTAVNNGLTATSAALLYAVSQYVTPKGKQVSVAYEIGASTNGFYSGNQQYGFKTLNTFDTVNSGGASSTIYGYDSQCFALPIALVHRRNTGMMHPVYNPNGTKLASDSLPWYSTTISVTSIADCFTESKLLATSGYIGTATGRSDGLFYDQIHEGDITDLRMNSRGINDFMRTMDTYTNKLQAATYRGTEGEKYTEAKVQTTTGTVATVEVNDGTRYNSGSVIYIYDLTAGTVKGRFNVKSIATNTLTVDTPFAKFANNYLISGASSTRTKSNTLSMVDVIGNPANYPATWKTQYSSLTSLHTAEDGTSLLPTGTTGSDGLATFKLSRDANSTPLHVLKSTDSGVTWTVLTVTTHYTFNTTTNAITFTAGNIPLTTDLIRVTYQTHTVMATATANSEVIASGRAIAMNGASNGHLGYSLIGKVMTASTSPYVQDGYGAYGYRIDPTTLKFSTTSTEAPMHTAFTLGGMALGVPAIKTGMYITRSNGKAYLVLVFKEMKHNGTSVGDDAKFNIVDNVSTTTDNNAQTVLIGQKRVELPYFISAAE